MFIDRNDISEYPFKGRFVTYTTDESKPLDEQTEVEVEVLSTVCDIQPAQKTDAGGIRASFEIYFPFDKEKGINIKRGMTFIGSMYGLAVNGVVIDVAPSQLGGCVAYLTDRDV